MSKRNSVWAVIFMVLILGCSDREKVEQLSAEKMKLQQEKTQLEAQNTRLRQDLEKLQKNFAQLNFLAEKLRGVKARIVTNYGDIELKFYPQKAPLHVFSFVTRSECGYYDNTRFHRIIPGFMIQGGDPNSRDNDPYNDGSGGPLVNIPHEFNDIHHRPGVLSMARVSDLQMGAGSQFFIMHGEAPHLDQQYTAFGEVSKGMNVVNEIANLQTYGDKDPRRRESPIKPVIIRRIEVYR